MSIDPGSPSPPVVQITLREVYSEVTGMRQEIRDLTNAVRTAVDQGRDHESRIRAIERDGATGEDLEKVESRVGSLERRVWMAGGAVAVVSAGASGLIGYVMSAR